MNAEELDKTTFVNIDTLIMAYMHGCNDLHTDPIKLREK